MKTPHLLYPRGTKVFVVSSFRVIEATVQSIFLWKDHPEPKYEVEPLDKTITGPFLNGFLESEVYETYAEANAALGNLISTYRNKP